jgi:hypothetical protein
MPLCFVPHPWPPDVLIADVFIDVASFVQRGAVPRDGSRAGRLRGSLPALRTVSDYFSWSGTKEVFRKGRISPYGQSPSQTLMCFAL